MNSTTLLTPSRRPAAPLVIQPLHGAYDHARRAWNLHADLRPAGVVAAATVEQVKEAVAFARRTGLRIAPQGTGHLATALPDLGDALLVRTALHDTVEIDPVARRARVSAGALWEDVVDAAAPHGLVALHGSSPNVGVVGYILGGGLSFYARRHGLASSHVHAIEVVCADGELRRVDAEHEPELFWALRGGGGSFGIVTAVEIELFEITEVMAGNMFWPVADAAAVVPAWIAWTREAPESVTTSLRILRLPPLPEVPEPLRAVPVVCVDGVALDAADGAALTARLRAAAEPMIDTWGTVPAPEILRLHGDPEPPTPGLSDTAILGELDEAAIAAFVAVNGEDSGSPLVIAELRQLGGAVGRPAAGGGATSYLPGAYVLFGLGVPMGLESEEAIEEHLRDLRDAMAPWETGRTYLNFAERGGSGKAAYSDEDHERLVAIRDAVDPDRLWVGSHALGED